MAILNGPELPSWHAMRLTLDRSYFRIVTPQLGLSGGRSLASGATTPVRTLSPRPDLNATIHVYGGTQKCFSASQLSLGRRANSSDGTSVTNSLLLLLSA